MFPYSSSPVEDTTADISATDKTIRNITSTTKPNEFFDPTWQLAMTIQFYVFYVVIAIGVFGVAANGLVLYALISHHARQTKKRAVNLLLINQNLLDLTSSLLLIISYSVGISNIYMMTDALGYFMCFFIRSGNASDCALLGSVFNLMAITVERYLKVVHPFWSRKYMKRWMIHAAMVFSWIFGILVYAPIVFVTTVIENGMCLALTAWESVDAKIITYVWIFSCYFGVPVTLLIFCYARIVVVVNRQMNVMAAHNVEAGPMSTSQLQSKRTKWNVIKTMIMVSVSYFTCFFPTIVIWIIAHAQMSTLIYIAYHATLVLTYIYICMNPFIYAIKHDGVKEELVRILKVCRKQVAGNVVEVAPRNIGDNGGNSQINRAQLPISDDTPIARQC